MEVKLGNYVKTKGNNYLGRVYQKHYGFWDTNEDENWLAGLSLQPTSEQKKGSWYSILTHEGGSILTWEDDVEKIEPFDLENNSEDFYFDKEILKSPEEFTWRIASIVLGILLFWSIISMCLPCS